MPADKLEREFVTSEGIDLRLRLGSAGERAIAFIIDFAIQAAIVIVLLILASAAFDSGGDGAREATLIILLLGFFLIRNGYFLAFELGMRAATPGKRVMKLRVVARDGGRLTGEAVVARNAMRELEFWLPLTTFWSFFVSLATADGDLLISMVALATVILFLLFPLLNRDNLRVGDLLAGTWVVRQPRRQLGNTVGQRQRLGAQAFIFTDAQLDAYGEYELQRLEEVLRRQDDLSMLVVARAIRRRIDWQGGGDEIAFLEAYYTALCLKLERNMLFGKRRADKYSK